MMMNKSKNNFPAWTIAKVREFLINKFHAVEIPLNNSSLQEYLYYDEIPDRDSICGAFVIYYKPIIDLLQGKIERVDSMEYKIAIESPKNKVLEDINSILDVGALILLKSKDNHVLTDYYTGGSYTDIPKIQYLFDVFLGWPRNEEKNSLDIVRSMGLL